MWLSLRFLLSFYLLKGFFSSFSWLLLRVKGRGCHTLLKPYETNCGLWIWAILIKFDWFIDWLIDWKMQAHLSAFHPNWGSGGADEQSEILQPPQRHLNKVDIMSNLIFTKSDSPISWNTQLHLSGIPVTSLVAFEWPSFIIISRSNHTTSISKQQFEGASPTQLESVRCISLYCWTKLLTSPVFSRIWHRALQYISIPSYILVIYCDGSTGHANTLLLLQTFPNLKMALH